MKDKKDIAILTSAYVPRFKVSKLNTHDFLIKNQLERMQILICHIIRKSHYYQDDIGTLNSDRVWLGYYLYN